MITKEHIEQAKRDTIQIYDDLLANFEEEKFAKIKKAYWENGNIVVEYENAKDILYGFGDKVFSVVKNVDGFEDSGTIDIDVSKYDKDWWVRPVGDEDGGLVYVGSYEVPKESEKKEIMLGWWNPFKTSEEALKYSNCNLLESANLEDIEKGIKYGKVIPMIGGFGATGSGKITTDRLIEAKASQYHKYPLEKHKNDILYVAVQDEPWGRGKMSNHQIEVMMDAAATMDVPVGLTITRSNALNDDDIIPESTDWIQIQAFPFFRDDLPDGYPQIWNKQDFMDDWDNLLTKVQDKLERPMIITAQGFYNDRWRQSPDESILWYYELTQMYDFVKGITIYAWHDKTGKGVNTMPGYFENVKKAYSILK